MRTDWMLIAVTVLPLVAGCATHYREARASEPHALLEFEKSREWWSGRAWPLELNGVEPPFSLMVPTQRKFRIHEGTMKILVAEKPRSSCWTCAEPRKICLLTFEAEAGKHYTVAKAGTDDAYIYVLTAGMTKVTECLPH